MVGKGVVSVLQGRISRTRVGSRADKVLSPAGQSFGQPMPRKISMLWSSTLVCGARLSQQWSGACLSYTLRLVDSHLLGLLISVLAPQIPIGEFAQEPMGGAWLFSLALQLASVEFAQDPIYGWSRFADTAVLIICADILVVSPLQMYLL